MNLLTEVNSIKDKKVLLSLVLKLSIILLVLYPLSFPAPARAVVNEAFVRFDRLETGADITGTACLDTATSGTESGVIITFPDGWTVSSDEADWTVTTTLLPAGASAWPGIGTATSVVGLSVRFPSTDLSTSTLYCFNFIGADSTVGSAGNDQTGELKTQGGAPYVDAVYWATSIVGAGEDQITVTASVSATMTFALSGNSVDLGTITTGTTTAGSAITQTISTNARNGWISWIKSTTDGGSGVGALYSTAANAYIVSPGSFDGTPEELDSNGGYVLDVNSGSGSPTVNAEYDGTTADEGGHLSESQFRETARATVPASGNTVTLVVKARSGSITPAATDYTDVLTVVAAGSF